MAIDYQDAMLVLAMPTDRSVHVVLQGNRIGAVRKATADAGGVTVQLDALSAQQKQADGHAGAADPPPGAVSWSLVEEVKRPPNG